jgi:pimeloyl-ACP methyl ester carboxylesterase
VGDGTVTANGTRIWFEDFGDPARPHVVLIMGANATATAWDRSFYEPIVAAGYHVVLFDNRDVGLSQWFDFEEHPYTLDDMAADTVGLMDALSIPRAHLIGASMGGMIAQVIALTYPERVLTLTSICSSPGVGDAELPVMSDNIVELAITPMPESTADRVDHLVAFYRAMAGTGVPFDEPFWRSRFESDMERGFNPKPGHGAAVASAPSRRHALQDLDLPTLVIHGDADPLLPLGHGVATAEAIPGAQLVTIAGAGHIDVATRVDEVIPPILELLGSRT